MPFLDLNETDAHDKKISLRDWLLLKTLWPSVRPHWRYVLASTLIVPLVSLSQIAQPLLVQRLLDGPITHGNWAGFVPLLAGLAGLMGLHYGLRYCQMLLAQVTGQKVILSLRKALFNHILKLPAAFFESTPIGKPVTRLSSDMENISEVFASGGLAILSDFVVIGGVIVGMAFLSWPLALCVLAMLILTTLVMEGFRRQSRNAYNDQRIHTAEMNAILQESITGMEVIHLLQQAPEVDQSFQTRSCQLMKAGIRSVVFDSTFTASIELLSVATLIVALAWAAWNAGHGGLAQAGLSIGVLAAFIQYIQMLFEPMEELSDKFTLIQSGLASLDKITELLEEPALDTQSGLPLSQSGGQIILSDVWFGYTPENPVLKGISLEVRPGEKVAIIGPSGAGKSTLIKLLNRQYSPTSGHVMLDGHDLSTYQLDALRRQVVVIPQEDFVFSRSVAENISLRPPSPDLVPGLEAVCQKVHADGWIRRLPEGLDTVLSERGRTLSTGERQLLMLARAMWHNPAVLILDEATSSIDPETEALLQTALQENLKDKTALIIAHRLSTIHFVDRVYVIEGGQIVASGPPQSILDPTQNALLPNEPKCSPKRLT